MSVDDREVVLEHGGPTHPAEDTPLKPTPKKRGTASGATSKTAGPRSTMGVVTATLLPGGVQSDPGDREQGGCGHTYQLILCHHYARGASFMWCL